MFVFILKIYFLQNIVQLIPLVLVRAKGVIVNNCTKDLSYLYYHTRGKKLANSRVIILIARVEQNQETKIAKHFDETNWKTDETKQPKLKTWPPGLGELYAPLKIVHLSKYPCHYSLRKNEIWKKISFRRTSNKLCLTKNEISIISMNIDDQFERDIIISQVKTEK